MSKNNFIFFIFIIILNCIYCYIIFNLELLPKENYKTLYDQDSPKDIISKELISSYFTQIEIGKSFQKIPLIIKPKIADYVITSIHQMSEPKRDYTSKKYVYDLSQNFLLNNNFFDEKKSDTYTLTSCEQRSPIDESEKPLAEQVCYSNETILFYTNKDLSEKKIMEKFYFELVRNAKDNITGTIGLNLNDMLNHVSLLSLLKKNKLIENYFWFFDFEKWDSNKGKLFLGEMPHNIYGNKYSNNNLVSTPGAGNDNYIFDQIVFDKIYFKNSSGENEIIGENEKAELNLESNVIIGKHNFRTYLNSSLNNLIKEKKCFFDTFEGYLERLDFYFDYDFFYCENTKEIKEKLNNIIPNIYFYSKDLNNDFELKKEQILKENGDYIYIYLIFCHQYNSWYLGKQISLKYQFVFNPDIKNVYFYKEQKQEEENKGDKYLYLKIIGIIALCTIFGVLGIVFGKKIYGMRKKRANELSDDDFQYISENTENNDNSIENNNNA